MAMTEDEANDLLPSAPVGSKPRPQGLVYLLIGPPKWGKTTWMCDIPNALLLASERGHQFQTCHKIAIDKWDERAFEIYDDQDDVRHMTMTQITEILEKSSKFDFIIFDTADMFVKLCLDYHLKKNGWVHANDGGDYGKGYEIVQNAPFRQLVGRIMATGRGVGFITHSEPKTTTFKASKATKRETTLPGGIHKLLHTQADVILHASFGMKQKGQKARDRVLQTEGDEETLAGNRTKQVNIPPKFIVDSVSPWGQWSRFFSDPTAAAEADREYLSSGSRRDRTDPEEEAAPDEAPASNETPAPTPETEAEPQAKPARKIRK